MLYFYSLEEAYEALRTFDLLGIGKELNIRASACPSVVDTLGSASSSLKDLFYALRVNMLLKCEISEEVFAVTLSFGIYKFIYLHFSSSLEFER